MFLGVTLADYMVQAGCLGVPFKAASSPVNHDLAPKEDLINRGAPRRPHLKPARRGPFLLPSIFPEGFKNG